MELNAKNYSLPINKVVGSCHELQKFVNQKGKIDLGDSTALYYYNKCLFKMLDNITIDLNTDGEELPNLIPTAGLRRLITSVILDYIHPAKVIEIGTGATAIMALLLAKHKVHVIATEINDYSYVSAQKNVILNNLNDSITLVKSEGEILSYLEKFFPADCVLSLPPYYADETKYQIRKKRGFRGTESELYSFGESTDFSLQLFDEWNKIESIKSLCILWKNQEDMKKVLNNQDLSDKNVQTFEIKAGTRLRYLTIIKKSLPEK